MNNRCLQSLSIIMGATSLAAVTLAAAAESNFTWSTVVNNNWSATITSKHDAD